MRAFRLKEGHTPEQLEAAKKKYSSELEKHERNAKRNKDNKDKVGKLFRAGMSKRERADVQYPYDIFKAAEGKQVHKAKLRKKALDIINRPKVKKEEEKPEPQPQSQPQPPSQEHQTSKSEPPKKKSLWAKMKTEQKPVKKIGVMAALRHAWKKKD